jgi:hypothetical protein
MEKRIYFFLCFIPLLLLSCSTTPLKKEAGSTRIFSARKKLRDVNISEKSSAQRVNGTNLGSSVTEISQQER